MSTSTHLTTYDPPKDAFTQEFTLLLSDGTPFNFSMADLADFQSDLAQLGITRGSMIGSCIVMLIALLLLTPAKKRFTAIFILNSLALLLNSIKQILMALFLTSPFVHPYAIMAMDYDRVTGIDKSNSIAVPVLQTILLSVVLASLLLQVNVIAATMIKTHRMILVGFCSLVALTALGFQFALMVVNCQNIMIITSGFTHSFGKLQTEAISSAVAALLLFTAIFTAKLGYAIFRRRRMGFVRFDPMQVIFIMGVQTLIVPSVIASLQFVPGLPEMNSWFLTLVTLSLPLSSLWASAALDGSQAQVSSLIKIPNYCSSTGQNDKSSFSQKAHDSMDKSASNEGTNDLEEITEYEGIVSKKSWSVNRSEAC